MGLTPYTRIDLIYLPSLNVSCYQETDNGGCRPLSCIMYQRRVDGTLTFNRNWKAYKEGFGTTVAIRPRGIVVGERKSLPIAA